MMTTVRKLLSVGILLLLLVACGRDKEAEPTVAPAAPQAPAAAATTAPQATAAPVATDALPADATAVPDLSGDPLLAITTAMAAQQSGGPYRATTTVESEGTITEMVAEVIPPNQMHVTIGGGNLEMIMLDGTLWSKSGGAEWVQMGSPDMMTGILESIQGQIDGSGFTNVQYVGAEPVFGEPTDVYSFTSTFGEGEGAISSDVKLWVSKISGLPIRMESSGSGAGVTSKTVQTVEYDDTITIEAPAQ